MKLTSCVKFFLLSLVGAISLVFICWGGNTSLQDIWINYSSRPEPWVGIFTACVLGVTAYASYKAGESAKIAGEMLELSRENGRKDDFIKQFTLLIEQHNKSHEIMMKVLDTYQIGENKDINWNMTIKEASDKLYLNHQFSPYMRMLFRVLKHCDENFYIQGDTNEITKEKKKYTSIVRSMIRNDVLYFVAINSMNELDVFNEYRNKLKKFDFFEHLIVDNIGKSIKFPLKIDGMEEKIKCLVKYELINIVNKSIRYEPFYIKNDDKKLDFKYIFNYVLASKYRMKKYNYFKHEIESEIKVEEFLNNLIFDLEKGIKYSNSNYFLYSRKYNTRNHQYSIDKKNDNFELSELSNLIINEGLNKKGFLKYIQEKYNINDFVFSLEDLTEGSAYSETDVYSYEEIYNICSLYAQCMSEKLIFSKKEKILSNINHILIKKLNETSFIKESGEKFILNEENKIVFENKNS
ncbi:TPA: hypothetical protein ACNHZZ_001266 [Proteus mirabilis]